jgi:endonuclease-3
MNEQAQLVDAAKTRQAHALLADHYGPRVWRGRRDPLDELVMTILSQNTSDRNSGRAYRALRQAFPSWPTVIDAPTTAVYEAIKPAGLGNIKAPRIQQTLRRIQERTGALSLDVLDAMPLDEARAWLLGLDGIGPKTAACVLMFALGRPALPVDTHVHRVSLRLGLIAPRVSAEKAHALLEAALPPEAVYAFHINLIQHGRLICHARNPACGRCPVAAICDFYRQHTER